MALVTDVVSIYQSVFTQLEALFCDYQLAFTYVKKNVTLNNGFFIGTLAL